MRTEIARIEIKHQEHLISTAKPQQNTIESKEMKFIINSHRNEIQELKAEIEWYKRDIKDKDYEISQIKEDKQVLYIFIKFFILFF